jgi:hypothetical protein
MMLCTISLKFILFLFVLFFFCLQCSPHTFNSFIFGQLNPWWHSKLSFNIGALYNSVLGFSICSFLNKNLNFSLITTLIKWVESSNSSAYSILVLDPLILQILVKLTLNFFFSLQLHWINRIPRFQCLFYLVTSPLILII